MAWIQSGDWMNLPEYVARFLITELPCNILTTLLSAMGIKGHSKLNHPLKAELFLKHMGRSDEEIKEILENLHVRTRKRKEEQEERAREDGEEPPSLEFWLGGMNGMLRLFMQTSLIVIA